MSPQMIGVIIGLILAVLTLGGGAMSIFQSGDAAKARKLAVEVDTVAQAAKSWVANDSTDNTFNGINAKAMEKYVSGFTVSGTGATSTFNSLAVPKGADGANPVTFTVAAATSTTTNDSVKITIANVPTTQQPILSSALTGKGCALGTWSSNSITYTCKG